MNELRKQRAERFRNTGLYLVIGHEFTNGRSVLDVLAAAADGGVRTVQLREKNLSGRELTLLAEKFRRKCDELGVLMLMNDHVDIALAVGADGVHLGQDDMPLEAARRIAPELILGRSTHSVEQALEAQAQGADYVNLGPVFPTRTKNTPVQPLGLEIIRNAAPKLSIPFSVMGGVKEHNIPQLYDAGARIFAMVTELTQADDVAAKARAMRALWEE
ncbi:MAG: thiamine phosphate synthase [Victivallales bacterium]|jgi:thiamine-phosphate diphosphorylase